MYLFQKTLVAFQNGVISIMEKILPCFPDKLPVLQLLLKAVHLHYCQARHDKPTYTAQVKQSRSCKQHK